ncbi:hypothetical protein N8T08_008131 [Aspergillus melleus]|uniref:Uncharacterized protein n=1 Tax=Aspergillus melleus TaxID=138277 RepID=A0ACC3AWI3_9EURO|nr:hypothetical protein N8T08_008131 [Aspergillus melleus]
MVFSYYGNKILRWFTTNEPTAFCNYYPLPDNYFTNTSIPKYQRPYWCGHHVLLAHSKAYHLGHSLGLNGTTTFKNNGGYKIPLTNSSEDAVAVQRAWDFNEGWFANPTFIDGDYLKYLKDFTLVSVYPTREMALADIIIAAPDTGIDSCVQDMSSPLYPSCANTTYIYLSSDGGWNISPAADPRSPWLHKATDWVPAFLRYITDTWKPAGGIAITEIGISEPFETLKSLKEDIKFDTIRRLYYRDYMEAILIAINDGVKVVRCLAWSILDNLEWASGYEVTLGIQYVNFTTQERAYKASFFE